MKNVNPGDGNDTVGGGGGGPTTLDALKNIPTWVWPVIILGVLGGGFIVLKLLKVF